MSSFVLVRKITASDSYPLLCMNEMIDGLGHNTYFRVLDARSAFWYQRMINFIVSPFLGRHTMVYLNVVVYSCNFKEHLKHLEETLQLV